MTHPKDRRFSESNRADGEVRCENPSCRALPLGSDETEQHERMYSSWIVQNRLEDVKWVRGRVDATDMNAPAGSSPLETASKSHTNWDWSLCPW